MEDIHMKSFLQQLYQMGGGDTGTDVSMYEVGDNLGLDKNDSGAMAEDLIIDGFAELKTLAGGIAITEKGLEKLGKKDAAGESGTVHDIHVLGSETALDDTDRAAVLKILEEIKQAAGNKTGYDELEELVIDIKTIEVHLLSPRPKTSIVRSALGEIGQQMQRFGDQQLAGDIKKMTAV